MSLGCQKRLTTEIHRIVPFRAEVVEVKSNGGVTRVVPAATNGGGARLVDAFPADTRSFSARYNWDDRSQERWVELGPVPVEPWIGPVGEYGLEFEVIVGYHTMSARVRPLHGDVRAADERRSGFPRWSPPEPEREDHGADEREEDAEPLIPLPWLGKGDAEE